MMTNSQSNYLVVQLIIVVQQFVNVTYCLHQNLLPRLKGPMLNWSEKAQMLIVGSMLEKKQKTVIPLCLEHCFFVNH